MDTYAELTYVNTADISGTANYLVKADETANNYWAIYTGTALNGLGLKYRPTTLLHTGVTRTGTRPDGTTWSHDENTKIDKQVTYQYELDTLDLAIGKHVKVTSADTGGWKLFMKTATGWENVGTENGTIRLSTKLYDYSQDASGFAGADTFR